MIDVSHGKCVGRFLRCLHTTNLFSLIWSSLIVVSSIRDLRISWKMPIDSLMHLYSAFCKSIEGVFRTILLIPLPELTHHATERTYSDPIWPLVHFTTFGDRWPQRMQMTANNYKSPAMHSAACNKICSYIHCPLINDGNSFDYLLYCRGHYRLLPARAHFVKKSHFLHSHLLSLFFNAKKIMKYVS